MKCPRCWGDALFEEYEFKKNEKKWVRKIYCPICYHREVLDVTGEEPLEDRIEFSLQTWIRKKSSRTALGKSILRVAWSALTS